MKTNLEKPNKTSKIKAPEVSPKALVDELNKKIPRKNTNRIHAYGYQRPMGKLVSEKGPSEAKPRRSSKKLEEELVPEQTNLDMQPLDEKEEWNHTKKGNMSNKKWKTPENIPVEKDFTEDFDNMGLKELLGIKEEEMSYEDITNSIKQFENDKTIEEVVSEDSHHFEYESFNQLEPEVLRAAADDFIESGSLAQQVHPQRGEPIHGDPTYQELRRPLREKNSGHDNLKTLSDSKKERQSRGFLSKIKNFWHELKNDTKDIAAELGWDEETELEKQRHQYQEDLKNNKLHYQQLEKDWKEDIDHATKEFELYEKGDDHDQQKAA